MNFANINEMSVCKTIHWKFLVSSRGANQSHGNHCNVFKPLGPNDGNVCLCAHAFVMFMLSRFMCTWVRAWKRRLFGGAVGDDQATHVMLGGVCLKAGWGYPS